MNNATSASRSGVAVIAAAVATLLLLPAVGHAQGRIFIMSGPGGVRIAGPPGARGEEAKAGAGVTADSLTALRKVVSAKKPLIIIDGMVAETKAWTALKADKIADVELKEASDGDLDYYGDKAKPGILTVTTKSDKAAEAQKGTPHKGRARATSGVKVQVH